MKEVFRERNETRYYYRIYFPSRQFKISTLFSELSTGFCSLYASYTHVCRLHPYTYYKSIPTAAAALLDITWMMKLYTIFIEPYRILNDVFIMYNAEIYIYVHWILSMPCCCHGNNINFFYYFLLKPAMGYNRSWSIMRIYCRW